MTTPDPTALAKLNIAEMAELVAELRADADNLVGLEEGTLDVLYMFHRAADALERLSQQPAGDGGWRPEVRAFADLMERELRANDHKGGWKGEMVWPLIERLREECDELHSEVDVGSRTSIGAWQARVGSEAADVANFAMMIADVCGALPAPPTAAPQSDEEVGGGS